MDIIKQLRKLEYNHGLGRVIDLTGTNNYDIFSSISDDKFIDEFTNLVDNSPVFEEPKIFINKLLNNKKVYQAQSGKVILTQLEKRKRLGVTKRKPVGWANNFIVEKRIIFITKHIS